MPKPIIRVRRAVVEDHKVVTSLLLRLLGELYDAEKYGYSADTLGAAARQPLQDGSGYWAYFAYTPEGTPVGVVGLNECSAIYAFGRFGEISELYVAPEYRSAGVGATLVTTGLVLAHERGWSLLEVGAPETPRWQRTVDFYLRCGFRSWGHAFP